MKNAGKICSIIVLALAGATTIPAAAQNTLGRLESDIRQANGQPAAAVPPGQHVYLGAIVLDDGGRGVRITGLRSGGPAERSGLRTQDLIVDAAGRRIHLLSDLTTILANMNPGDKLVLDVTRGVRTMRIEVVLGTPPGGVPHLAERPTTPPPVGPGVGPAAGPTETIPPPPSQDAGHGPSIPPPPGEVTAPPSSPAGPALEVPQPVAQQRSAQIEDLRHRVEQLEQRVKELERSLAEKK